jgi:N-methylhydantoinase A
MKLRIGIDVGGTFTDVTAFDEDRGELAAVRKYTSNPAQPAAVMDVITSDLVHEFGANSVSLILHGSTAALNTLLQDKGVRTGLLTTRGFRDVYEIGRQWRGDDVFNIFAPGPKMLLSRERIHEIGERLDAKGDVVEPLSADDVERATRSLVADGVEAIAVCFLFAYANPVHETAAAEIVRRIAPGLYVSLSHEVNPEWREYERTASTVANAYIGPPVARYLQTLEDHLLRTFPKSRALMMKSDGGAASARMIAPCPIQTVMSGPVAGVIGSRHLGDIRGIDNIITFDTGGTSSDMSVIPGRPLFKSDVVVARHPIRTHTIDIETIGAGGGSIASVQLGGVLKVGPQSAGAVPGPACYNRGGTEPTLTDALIVLGHLNPDTLLGGAMAISSNLARTAITSRIGEPLGLAPSEAAWGILRVLATNVMVAMRSITVERGHDPREFTLVPFGGMGPTIAGLISAELGIERILVPRDPGAFSAYGMLVTDVQQARSITRITPLDRTTPVALDEIFEGIAATARDDLVREGFAKGQVLIHRLAGMRYRGQSYEVGVPVDTLRTDDDLALLQQRFHAAHQRRYGHMAQAEAVEIVNFSVTAIGLIPKPTPKTFEYSASAAAPVTTRLAFFNATAAQETAVFRRDALSAGSRIAGPAIIEETTSTIVLYPGQLATVDNYLNIEVVNANRCQP